MRDVLAELDRLGLRREHRARPGRPEDTVLWWESDSPDGGSPVRARLGRCIGIVEPGDANAATVETKRRLGWDATVFVACEQLDLPLVARLALTGTLTRPEWEHLACAWGASLDRFVAAHPNAPDHARAAAALKAAG